MRRLAALMAILVLSPLAIASPEITVSISVERRLSDIDLGINGGEISPNKSKVIIFGEDGYAHLLSAKNAEDESTDIRLERETSNSLNAAAWHPGGKSALLVGDEGTVLRFNSTNFALGEAEGASAMSGKDIHSVHFTAGSPVNRALYGRFTGEPSTL